MKNEQRVLSFDQPITDDDVLSVMDEKHWRSYLWIARALGRKKTPSLVARVQSLASRKCLVVRFVKLPNGVDMHQFRLDPACERGFST